VLIIYYYLLKITIYLDNCTRVEGGGGEGGDGKGVIYFLNIKKERNYSLYFVLSSSKGEVFVSC